MSDLRDAVVAATQGTPYVVVDTKNGFDLHLDIADAQWWGLYDRAGLHKTFRWRVVERNSTFTITDRQIELRWRAGVPTVGASVEVQSGRIISLSRQKIWALSDGDRIEPVMDYRFNAREGRDLIRLAAQQLGLAERMPLVVKVALVAALLTPVGFAVYGLVLLIYKILGLHP